MKIFLIVAVSFLLSCGSKKEPVKKSSANELQKDSTSIPTKKIALSFFDSLSAKYSLTTEQIIAHTKIDSIFYRGINSIASFKSDTVLSFHGGLKGTIIDYDDRRNCLYKFLLVFDSASQNIGNKIIYADCDIDESTGHTIVRYKLMGNSFFETSETYFSAHNKSKENKKIKWEVVNPDKIGSCFKFISINTTL